MTFPICRSFIVIALSSALTGCTLGPNYTRPSTNLPSEFKEQKGWKTAQPIDQGLPETWWQLFDDATLNSLEEQVVQSNPSIAQAEAQYRQAQHLVQASQSSLLPVAMLTGTVNRFKAATGQSVAVSGVRNLFGQAVSVAWEPDLWGRVRRQLEASTDNAQARAANLRGLVLSSQATLAQAYFQIRTLDAQKALIDETIAAFEKTYNINLNRYNVGVAAKADVVQAETQLHAAQAQALDLGVQRARLEHAIAVLIGKTPAEFSLPPQPLTSKVPSIPTGLPSELLERRPDIAAAERAMAAANAQIGVAKAAYFPSLTLGVTNGFQSSDSDTLFTMARRYWALGPAGLALTLFDGGMRNAQYKQAMAAHDATIASYRQTVLSGIQEVEDHLAALHILEQESEVQAQAVDSAAQTLKLTDNQYKAGTTSYLNVLIAQTAALTNRQVALQLQGRRLDTAVSLIKALGGGWHNDALPTDSEAAGNRTWTDYLILPVD